MDGKTGLHLQRSLAEVLPTAWSFWGRRAGNFAAARTLAQLCNDASNVASSVINKCILVNFCTSSESYHIRTCSQTAQSDDILICVLAAMCRTLLRLTRIYALACLASKYSRQTNCSVVPFDVSQPARMPASYTKSLSNFDCGARSWERCVARLLASYCCR